MSDCRILAALLLIFAVPAAAQTQGAPAPPAVPAVAAKATDVTVGFGRTLPPWADDIAAVDTVNAGAGGPSEPSTVYLGPGVYQNNPRADVDVYNPTGPRAEFTRLFRTAQAANGVCSPGLSTGWTHNYDDVITASAEPGWGKLTLTWYNGAKDDLTPVVKDGKLTGELAAPKGCLYLVTGQPNASTPGRWDWLVVEFAGGLKWTFAADAKDPNTYRIRGIGELVGTPIYLYYDAANRLEKVTQTDLTPLMTLAYDTAGHLSTVTACYDKGKQKVVTSYVFEQAAGTACLTMVSQRGNPKLLQWVYGYTPVGAKPFLCAVGVPNPSGAAGLAVMRVNYDEHGRVSSMVDANSNQHCYAYGDAQTRIDIKNPKGEVEFTKTQKLGK